MTGRRSSRFSPHLVEPERLAALFVGRWPLVEQLVADARAMARAGGARRDLVVGPSGSGRSHLLALVAAGLERAAAEDGFRVARLGEDEYPASLVDLLSRLLVAMPPVEGLPPPGAHLAALRRAVPSERIATAVGLLEVRCGGRPLVMVLEELDRVLAALGRDGQAGLRAVLAAHPAWSIIASASTLGADFTGPRAPFYQGFTRVDLPPFTEEHGVEMLRRLALHHEAPGLVEAVESREGRLRVRALRHVVGPHPRAVALLFPCVREGGLHDVEAVLHALAEALTPELRAQVRRLPPGQRPYLERLAASWRPLAVGELAEQVFATPQTASGQLRYLAQDGLVRAIRVGREAFYEVADPLLGLAGAMQARDPAPVAFARFLVAWWGHVGEPGPAGQLSDTRPGAPWVTRGGEAFLATMTRSPPEPRAYARLAAPERALLRAFVPPSTLAALPGEADPEG